MNKLVKFLNSENFDNVNDAYSNFIPKLMEVIDKVAPVKNKKIKKNSQKWFDSEISKKLIIRDKLFKKRNQKSRVHLDKEINKTARYNAETCKEEKRSF